MKVQVLNNGRTDYSDALRQQEYYFQKAVTAHTNGQKTAHHLLLNEHNPILTLGLHADSKNILYPKEILDQAGIQVCQTNRGGDVTYHGPGQWVVYPIFDLTELGLGIRDYVHSLEQVAITVLSDYGLQGERIPGASGVWMHSHTPTPKKICAVGVKVSHCITMHGIAFNVSVPPDDFRWINPCGFSDKGVTNLCLEAGQTISMDEVAQRLITAFGQIFDRPIELLTP